MDLNIALTNQTDRTILGARGRDVVHTFDIVAKSKSPVIERQQKMSKIEKTK